MAVVPTAALGIARQTDPGTHVVVLDVDDGRHVEATVTVAERESKDVTLDVPAPKPGDTPPPNGTRTTTSPVTDPNGPITPLPPDKSEKSGAHRSCGLASRPERLASSRAPSGGLALSSAQTCTTARVVGADGLPQYSRDLADALLAVVRRWASSSQGRCRDVQTGLILGGASTKTATVVPFVGR